MKYTRKLIRFSHYSLCVTLPVKYLRKMGIGKGDAVDITYKDKSMTIKKATEEV